MAENTLSYDGDATRRIEALKQALNSHDRVRLLRESVAKSFDVRISDGVTTFPGAKTSLSAHLFETELAFRHLVHHSIEELDMVYTTGGLRGGVRTLYEHLESNEVSTDEIVVHLEKWAKEHQIDEKQIRVLTTNLQKTSPSLSCTPPKSETKGVICKLGKDGSETQILLPLELTQGDLVPVGTQAFFGTGGQGSLKVRTVRLKEQQRASSTRRIDLYRGVLTAFGLGLEELYNEARRWEELGPALIYGEDGTVIAFIIAVIITASGITAFNQGRENNDVGLQVLGVILMVVGVGIAVGAGGDVYFDKGDKQPVQA